METVSTAVSEEQSRLIDNRLLQLVQRMFPSIPVEGNNREWDKWLAFARAAYDMDRAAPPVDQVAQLQGGDK